MVKPAAVALAFIAVALALSGCMSGGETAGNATGSAGPEAPPASVSRGTGGIEGVVLSEEMLPVEEAHVGLRRQGGEFRSELWSAGDGTFSFSNLDPGAYVLNVTAEGFHGQTLTAQVVAGEVARITIILAQIVPPEPLIETHEQRGFINCSYSFDIGANSYSGNPCPIPTNEASRFQLPLDADRAFGSVVLEAVWQPTTAATGTWLQLLVCGSQAAYNEYNNCWTPVGANAWRSAPANGPSPLALRLEQLNLPDVTEYAVQVGDGGASVSPPRAPFTFQQSFDLYLSVCYEAPCGAEFSALPPP